MNAKVEEFRNISQGSQKIQEYANCFTRMMRYAPGETDSEKKKMYFFKKGLNTRIMVAISGHTCYTLREIIHKALEMERDCFEAKALCKEKKRRFECTSCAWHFKGQVHMCLRFLTLILTKEPHPL